MSLVEHLLTQLPLFQHPVNQLCFLNISRIYPPVFILTTTIQFKQQSLSLTETLIGPLVYQSGSQQETDGC